MIIHSIVHPACTILTPFTFLQKKYAFIEYENDADAERAKTELGNKDMGGLPINIRKYIMYRQNITNLYIEWSKKSKNFDADGLIRPEGRDRERGDKT